ncbi:MAG TPA: hypothetical protein VGF42_08390 [Caulobacteraceae bacterium]|jgi:hypothetical protein
MNVRFGLMMVLALPLLAASPVVAQETATPSDASAPAQDAAELAKKLANPISNLISVPFQNNYDCCYGPAGGGRYQLNVQPVIPFSISTHWNVIVRTIMPVIYQGTIAPGAGDSFGFGDVTQSFFFSPKAPVAGLIVGAGPVIVYPLGNAQLGSQKWSAGGTFVVLKQAGHWTIGLLANHVWSFAGDSSRAPVSATFLQPFLNYTMRDSTSFTFNTESTYNWIAHSWSVPLNANLGHVYRFGRQLVQLSAGPRVWLTTPAGGPGWGVRANVTLLFPRR